MWNSGYCFLCHLNLKKDISYIIIHVSTIARFGFHFLLLMFNQHLKKDMTSNFQMTHILRKSEVRCWLYTWKPETFYYLNKSTNVRFIVPWSKLSTVWNGWNKSWCCLDPLHSNSYQFFTDHNKVLIIHTIVGVVLWM